MTLETALDAFLHHLAVERGLAGSTVEAYGRDLGDFVRQNLDRSPGSLDAPAVRVGPWTGAAFGVVAGVCAVGVVGGFRSSPWLDDAWGIWLPKGLALWHHGLDDRLFAPSGEYVTFGVPDYPLWWSVVTSLDVQAVGSTDVRVTTARRHRVVRTGA